MLGEYLFMWVYMYILNNEIIHLSLRLPAIIKSYDKLDSWWFKGSVYFERLTGTDNQIHISISLQRYRSLLQRPRNYVIISLSYWQPLNAFQRQTKLTFIQYIYSHTHELMYPQCTLIGGGGNKNVSVSVYTRGQGVVRK
jgi:hypothetical protein